jgi:hypothetical protein
MTVAGRAVGKGDDVIRIQPRNKCGTYHHV